MRCSVLPRDQLCCAFGRVVQYTQTESDRLKQCTVRLTGSHVVRHLEIWHVGLLAIHTQTESDRGRQCTVRLKGKSVRERKYGRWASERVEMSAGRIDRTRGVTTRLIKSDLTNRKSVRERLSKNGRWASERVEMSADRLDQTRAVTTRLANCDPTKRKSKNTSRAV